MKTINPETIESMAPNVACIGYFDGFHQGHRKLMETALNIAKERGLEASMITFDPDPWVIFRPDADFHHLMTMKDRQKAAEAWGFDNLIIFPFTKAFASLSVDEFHKRLEALNIKVLVCGFDYTYGTKGSGNYKTLQEATAFETVVIDCISDGDEKISTSRIESLILEGNVKEASRFLGYLYSIEGTVVSGYQRGRLMNFPTANLEPDPEYLIPAKGVYAGYVECKGKLYQAMINVGTNPTFGNRSVSVEANIFDFDQSIYGCSVRFAFYERIRDEKRFAGMEELIGQLNTDKEKCRRILSADEEPVIESLPQYSIRKKSV